jgi:hypothetical protein
LEIKEDKNCGSWNSYGELKNKLGNLKGRDHLGDKSIDGRMILKYRTILNK